MALYDISKNFKYNCEHGPFFEGKIPNRLVPPENQWYSFLGYKIASQIGMPAGPMGTSKGIALAAQLGFDVLTYKTFRSTPFAGHPWPNICFVDCPAQFSMQDVGSQVVSKSEYDPNNISITTSFGNVSPDFDRMQHDISLARDAIYKGQLLIVSVFGTEQENRSIVQDFVYTALIAQEAGAQVIEANLSCPNISGKLLYKDSSMVYEITKQISRVIDVPLIIKLGIFDSAHELKTTLLAAAHGGVRAICGINAVPMQIVNKNNEPTLGLNRRVAGISGNAIRSLAQQFVKDARSIIEQEKLNLKILATGGVSRPEHFSQFLDRGASVAMSATGMMWNPYLAHEFHSIKGYRRAKLNAAEVF